MHLSEFHTWLTSRYAINTAITRFKAVRLFYSYLVSIGQIESNPAAEVQPALSPRTARNILTLPELSAMWMSAHAGRERVVIGLLGICGLRRNELRQARVEDLHEREGVHVLTVPQRTSAIDIGYVALPVQVASEVSQLLRGRRAGLVLRSDKTGHAMAATSIHKIVRKVATRAGIVGEVTTLSLSYTLRSLALRHGFSHASVVRTVPSGATRTLQELTASVHISPHEHASMRLGEMVVADASDEDMLLLQASILVHDRAQHPATSILLSATTLERALRLAVNSQGLTVTKRDPTLSTYATLLRSRDLLTIGQLRTVEMILGVRNQVAHGWFEEVDRARALWVLDQVRDLIRVLGAL